MSYVSRTAAVPVFRNERGLLGVTEFAQDLTFANRRDDLLIRKP
jgi:hypothetical protein